MDKNDLKEFLAYTLLGVVVTAITFWGVTLLEHKEKATVIESGCKQ